VRKSNPEKIYLKRIADEVFAELNGPAPGAGMAISDWAAAMLARIPRARRGEVLRFLLESWLSVPVEFGGLVDDWRCERAPRVSK